MLESGSFLRSAEGRVRLGWRLLLFLALATLVTGVVAVIMPPTLVGGSTAMLIGAVVAGGVALSLDGRSLGALGFHIAASVPKEMTLGTGLGVLLAVTVALVATLAGGVTWALEEGSWLGWLTAGVSAASLLVIPAAAEEALLRGYPLQALAEAWGPAWALVLTSVVFGLLHLPNPGVTALGAVGVTGAGFFLGALYLRTGSLWWATGAHLGWNWGLGFLADTPVSGLEVADAPYVAATLTGPEWLGGGQFGLEGSILATAGFVGAAAAVWWGPWLQPEDAALARRPLALGEKDGRSDSGALSGSPTNA